MVEVTYHCPYCGAVTGLERDPYMADKCVTREPLDGWEYAPTTGDYEAADGVEFVCLGDYAADGAGAGGVEDAGTTDDVTATGEDGAPGTEATGDGCGRTFYLSFVRFEDGREVDPAVPLEDYDDGPRFDFNA